MTKIDLDRTSLFEPQVLENPFPYYQAAIAERPVMVLPGTNITLVSSYDLLAEATGRIDEFSNDFSALLAGQRAADPDVTAELDKGWPQRNTLLTADPPVHTRFRKLVNLAFSMKRVDAIEADIRAIVNRLVDAFPADGRIDFVRDFAVPLPVAVIAGQIGIADTDVLTVKRWSDAFADRLGGMISKERELECAREVVEFQHAMKVQIDARRATPREDLLSDLVHARIEGEQPLDDAEILSILQQLMVAGNETTTSTLAGGVLLLIENPAEEAKVRADPKLIPNMVEEMLRLESPTAGLWRVVKQDAELGGVTVPGGSMMMLRFAAANRDPARFENPDAFEVTRKNARSHLAFGRGIHMCVGNMLSRKELAVAFEVLLARISGFRLAADADLAHVPNMLLRGLRRLDIEVTRA
ncbi:cytochrome P450 [Sandarakinorhabdus sp. DWP1-3-1]|uniref:cytochrome P450 n=1 Tax=Sandarakinorhabdus sp. DWP1-3-1 TaxID=2804627 RepID=UPI003CFAB559